MSSSATTRQQPGEVLAGFTAGRPRSSGQKTASPSIASCCSEHELQRALAW